MDLRLVTYFVAVVDHGGITRAARALYLAQPSLSQAIHTLEDRLGVPLFDRSGRGVVLTANGESFLRTARRILHDIEVARARVHEVRDRVRGRLVVAALPTLAVDPLPELAAGLRARHPGIVLSVTNPGDAPGIVADVRAGRAEVGFTELPARADNLLQLAVDDQELVLALPPELAAELPDPVPLAAVADLPLVLEPVRSTTRALLESALGGPPRNVVVECAHRPAIWRLVQRGAGATLLPRTLAARELGGSVVVRSTRPALRRTVGLVLRPGPVSPAADALLTVAGVSPPGPGPA